MAASALPGYLALMSDPVRRMIPNLLTLARVGLAGCFFAIVAVALWPKQGAGYDVDARQVWGNWRS